MSTTELSETNGSQKQITMKDEKQDPLTPYAAPDASSEDPDEHLPLLAAIKKFPRVFAFSVSLSIIAIGWGYDMIVIGSIVGVESFQRDYGVFNGLSDDGKETYIIPAVWLSLWQASSPLGMCIGSLFGGWFQDRLGRRAGLFFGSVVAAIGIVGIFVSSVPESLEAKRGVFFAGKIVQGYAIGVLKIAALAYISETAPVCLRGSTMALVPTGNLFGQFLGAVVVYIVNNRESKTAYLGAFASQFIIAIVPFIIACLMPESPSYLEEKGLSEKAAQSAEKLYAPKADAGRMLQTIRNSIEEQRALVAGTTYLHCFQSLALRRTMLVVLANLIPTFFGLDLIGKSSYFVQQVGLSARTSLMMLMVGIAIGIISNGFGIWIMSRVGRRTCTLIGLIGVFVLWLAISISGFWRGTKIALFTGVALIVILIVCGTTVWPASYAIMGETSSLRLRAKTQAIGSVAGEASSVAMSFALPYVYNPDAGDLGGKTGFIYVGLTLVGLVMAYFLLPELKDRTIAEIDHMFEMKLPARKFKGYKTPDNME